MSLQFEPAIRRAFVARRYLELLGYPSDYVFFENRGVIDPQCGKVVPALVVALRLTKDPAIHPDFVVAAGLWHRDFQEKLSAALSSWNAASQGEREALIEEGRFEMPAVEFALAVKAKGLHGLPS